VLANSPSCISLGVPIPQPPGHIERVVVIGEVQSRWEGIVEVGMEEKASVDWSIREEMMRVASCVILVCVILKIALAR